MKTLVCSLCLLSTAAFAYDAADLEALKNQGSYAELLEHATDVAPKERDEKWKKLVADAASQVMGQASESKLFEQHEKLTARFPFLAKDAGFQRSLSVKGLDAVERCWNENDRKLKCDEKAKQLVDGNAQLGFELAKRMTRHFNVYEAVPTFRLAIDGGANSQAQCEDTDLYRAMQGALGLPFDDKRAADARAVMEGKCAAAMRDDFEGELSAATQGSYFAKNACPAFQKAKALPKENPCR